MMHNTPNRQHVTTPTRRRLTSLFAAALTVASVAGCAQHTRCEYAPQVVTLDSLNEVVFSTFPSGFARVTRHVPFVFKRLESPPSVNLQMFVRARGTTAGRNPHIDSILVRRLSYEFPGQTPVPLVQNYADGFWQQGQSEYQSEHVAPIQCVEGWYIRVRFDLTLNGNVLTGEDTLFARERTRRYALLFDALR